MEISRKGLKKALASITKVIPRKADVDWQTCVLFDHDGNGLTVKGADGHVSMSLAVESGIRCDEPMQILIDAYALKRIVDKGPKSETVRFGETVSMGGFEFNIRQEDPDAFEMPFMGDEGFRFIVDGHGFGLLASGMSDDVKRPQLQGVFADVAKGFLVSTNGERMFAFEVDEPKPSGEPVIIPAKAVTILTKLAAGHSVNVVGNENATKFNFGCFEIVAKNVDGAYPNWSPIFNLHHDATEVVVDTESIKPLIDALSASSAFLEISSVGGGIRLNGHNVNADVFGEPFTTRIRTDYVADALTKAEVIKFQIPRASGPVHVVADDQPKWMGAIMPSSKRGE